MNSTSPCLPLMTAAALLAATPGLAEEFRQHAAHVHGEATGNLSLDGGRLRLELEIPGVNLVGFEYAPRDQAQQSLLDNTLTHLRSGDWLRADGRGGCDIADLDAHTRGFDADHDDQHQRDHKHDHDGGHDGDHAAAHDHRCHGDDGHDDHHHHHDHDHAEFHVVAHLDCRQPDKLRWVEVHLFQDYPGNQHLRVDVLTDSVATQVHLRARRERIDLQ